MKRRRQLRPVAINPLVVDLSHHNDVADFGKVKAAGYAGIIHKATEAIGFLDNMYAIRRGDATDAGLLWGAYHFLRPVSIAAQVDFFLKIASPDNTTLLALDHFRCPLLGAKRTSVLVLRMVVSDPKQYRTSNIDLNHSFRARTIVNYNLTFGI